MKKKNSGSSAGLISFAVVGLLAVGGVVAYRKQQENAGPPSYGPEPVAGGPATTPTPSTGYTPAPFGVNADRYYGLPFSGGFSGGLIVTAGGGTRTPTSTADASNTSGGGYGTPVRYPSFADRYAGLN